MGGDAAAGWDQARVRGRVVGFGRGDAGLGNPRGGFRLGDERRERSRKAIPIRRRENPRRKRRRPDRVAGCGARDGVRAARRGWDGPHRPALPAHAHLGVQGAGFARGPRRGLCRYLAIGSGGRVGAPRRRLRPGYLLLRQATHRRAGPAGDHREHRRRLRRLQGTDQDPRAAPRTLLHRLSCGLRRRRRGDANISRPGGKPELDRRGRRAGRWVGVRKRRPGGRASHRPRAAERAYRVEFRQQAQAEGALGRNGGARDLSPPKRRRRDRHRLRARRRGRRRRRGRIQQRRHEGDRAQAEGALHTGQAAG
mmetsp:Transcript_10426/g.42057  ORF Transcript_10426/g.42057 Transcript_10426/m.42057 type:complete len:310 (-) Transcript_10426:870-1799(-)